MQRGRDKRKDLAHLEFSKRAEPLENLLHWRREHLKKRRIKNLIRRGHVPEATTKLPHPAFFEKSRSKSRPIETYALEIETHALEEQEHESINNQEDKTASSIHVFARIREPPRKKKKKNLNRPESQDPDLLLHDTDANGDLAGAAITLHHHHCGPPRGLASSAPDLSTARARESGEISRDFDAGRIRGVWSGEFGKGRRRREACVSHTTLPLFSAAAAVRVRGRDWRSRLVRVRCDGRAASSGAAAEVERLLSAPKCGLASGLVAIAKFVCDTVCYCSCRVHTKRETQERLVEKDFSFFISFS